MKQISIIVPVYNGEKTIEACIQSALTQTYPNIQLIVVDNGSTDRTVEICQKYVATEGFLLIREKKQGVVAGRKAGIARATGEYLAFLDADDEMKPNMLQELVSVLERDHADIAICGYENVNGQISNCFIPDTSGLQNSRADILRLYTDENILGFLWNRLYKKEIFTQIDWDESMVVCEDLYANCWLLANHPKIKVTVVPQALYRYTINQNSVTHTIDRKIDTNGDWRYLTAYQKITQLFEGEEQLYRILLKAQLICVRLGIEELKDHRKYQLTKKRLMQYGRKNIGNMLCTDVSFKYKLGWMCRVIFG